MVLLGVAGWGGWFLWIRDPLREVRAALDRRDFTAANELLAKHLAKYPDDARTLLLAARAARRGGDFTRASDHLQRYREKKGADEAFELESSLLRAQGGNLAEADRLFTTYSARPELPETPWVMEAYLEGKLKVFAPRTDAVSAASAEAVVVANLRQAVELWLLSRPGRADQVQGRVWQARVLIFAGDYAEGQTALREALELDPNHFDARFYLALALAAQSPDESRRHLEVLRSRYPENDYVRFGLAGAYRLLGRLKESRELLEGLVAGRTEVSALIELGQLDMDEGKVADADRRLQKALELAPNSPDANIAMSRCQLLAGRPADAERYRKRFEELDAARKLPPKRK